MLLGEKIYKLRKINGLSQEDLAAELNVSRQAVSKWERGITPDIENMVKIANFFDCSLDDLMNDNLSSIDDIGNEVEEDIITEKQKSKLNEYWAIKTLKIIPVTSILIMWVLSKIIKFPITHQDSKSGNFYTGFVGFIDYFSLRGVLYICISLWLTGISAQLIWRLYIRPRKTGNIIGRKTLHKYIVHYLLLLLGTALFTYGLLNPWKFIWTIRTLLVFSLYLTIVVVLSIQTLRHDLN
ncbi:Transcriptional regulator, contains XRE-family HTH domain [Clostridium cochlearium]|uniref:Transcriptional regulator, contains XRE-family HTH domain n=1 Tax=Clostridium cochlearium TaxID=1494 RepID=A0ABY0QPB4_CLOCO|nr:MULTISPECIES: helix-turn-helix transcriptional regulator [Clostridia]SDL42906.1 Transcriptional regulator, contains XRE-family HTH domain [Clostridium cochlearium]